MISFVSSSPGYTYIVFDIINDLAFGSPFGLLNAATNSLPLAMPQSDEGAKGDVKCFHIFKVVQEHGYIFHSFPHGPGLVEIRNRSHAQISLTKMTLVDYRTWWGRNGDCRIQRLVVLLSIC